MYSFFLPNAYIFQITDYGLIADRIESRFSTFINLLSQQPTY